MEPLALLRKYASEKRHVQDDGSRLIFGDLCCDKMATTNFKIHGGGHYTIGCLWFLWKNIGLEHGQYLLEARKTPFGSVTRLDRKDVVSYITGEAINQGKLDPVVFVEPAVRVDAEPAHKRPRLDDPATDAAATDQQQTQQSQPHRTAESTMLVPGRSKQIIQDVMNREISFQDRRSIVRSSGKSFDRVLTMLQTTRKDVPKASAPGSADVPKKSQQRAAYDRYDQPGVAHNQGDEFQINEEGTFMTQSDYTPGTMLMSLTDDADKPKVAESGSARDRKKSKTPIIIVPAGMTCMITIHNVKKFLEEGCFISQEEAKQTSSKSANVAVYKKHEGQNIPYKIVDNVNGLTPADWNRVVAIFCAGPEWQFKGWPWHAEGGVVNVFTKARGFFVTFDDQKLPQGLEKWDVCVLRLSRSRRHLDSTASRKFWETLDKFTLKHRTDLYV